MSRIDVAYEKFCKTRFPLPTDAQIAKLERRIGTKLPDDYRSFLLRYNGGYFQEPDIECTCPGCPEDALNDLYGIGATVPAAELTSESILTVFDDKRPARILPIGYTISGNLLVLITRPGKDRGAIMLKEASSDNYYPIARPC